ncbi:putative 6-deoxyerythronolide-B synthase [Desulfamplus magnetovallimortis]|uniref:Putative 6-deoxyerythronolide-B synthase n=2 Tax=Desulfamplus magnetovallimortis TaxID=1246637 RepID=A0A1W1HKV9_9BACT|nr:putative 6-deoxyerythronolide-B synthase [Desulfamplus magnetovallimortis]
MTTPHLMKRVYPFFDNPVCQTSPPSPLSIAGEGENNAKRVHSNEKQAQGSCALGSLKSNVGHLDTAAGVASLIKTVLSLQNNTIPPMPGFKEPNPKLDMETGPFFVNSQPLPWIKKDNTPRRAGVSSFGQGGTNAHVIVEEAPDNMTSSSEADQWNLLTISARSPETLEKSTQRVAAYLKENLDQNPTDVAFTLQCGRHPFAFRRAVLSRSMMEGSKAFASLIDIDSAHKIKNINSTQNTKDIKTKSFPVITGRALPHPPEVVFIFPGQDMQHDDMARGLYETEPLFRREVDLCKEILKKNHAMDIADGWYPSAIELPSLIPERASDPVPLFIVEYALARMWQGMGIQPSAMLGYSLGEYTAACIAGVISLEDGLGMAVAGARLLSVIKPGVMLGISMCEKDLLPLMGEDLDIAMISTPSQCVAGGEKNAVEQLEETLKEKAVPYTRLPLDFAFHTRLMEPFLNPFRKELEKVKFNPPQIPYISCVTGAWINAHEAMDPEHYLDLARRCVRLADGFKTLANHKELRESTSIWLETGPGQGLAGLAMQQPDRPSNNTVISTLHDPRYHLGNTPSSSRTLGYNLKSDDHGESQRSNIHSDTPALLAAMARMWVLGLDIKWENRYMGKRRQRIPLPTYPFDSKKYWIEPAATNIGHNGNIECLDKKPDTTSPSKYPDPSKWFYIPVWEEVPLEKKGDASGLWLVVGDSDGIDQALEKQGIKVISVSLDHAPLNLDHAPLNNEKDIPAKPDTLSMININFILNDERHEGWSSLLDTLKKKDMWPDHIVYTGLLGNNFGGEDRFNKEGLFGGQNHTGGGEHLAKDDFSCQQNTILQYGYHKMVELGQALGKLAFSDQLSITVVGSGIFSMYDNEAVDPSRAAVIGPLKVLPQEYTNLKCRLMDIIIPDVSWKREKFLQRVTAELTARDGERSVALRGNNRWVEKFKPFDLPVFEEKISGTGISESRSKSAGTYLITGGLGNVGLTLAGAITGLIQDSTVILTGRRPLPEPEMWNTIINSPDSDPALVHRLGTLQALLENGADIELMAADVTDMEAMQAIMNRIDGEDGEKAPLRGVIHAAGLVGADSFATVSETTHDFSMKQISPKLKGTHVLEQLLKDRHLDFCILCSSLSPILGGLGFTAYAAANASLDAMAISHNRKHPVPWLSVNWEGWRFEDEPSAGQAGASIAEMALTPADGVEAFKRILSMSGAICNCSPVTHSLLPDIPRIVVSTGNLDGRISQWVNIKEEKEQPSLARHPRPALLGECVPPGSDVEKELAELWEKLLGIDGIGIYDSFFDLGGNSLLMTQLVTQIRKAFKLELSLAELFDKPTIRDIAAQIEETVNGNGKKGGGEEGADEEEEDWEEGFI